MKLFEAKMTHFDAEMKHFEAILKGGVQKRAQGLEKRHGAHADAPAQTAPARGGTRSGERYGPSKS